MSKAVAPVPAPTSRLSAFRRAAMTAYLAGELEAHLGNVSAAARHLGVSRQAVQRAARRYGVRPDDFRPASRRHCKADPCS